MHAPISSRGFVCRAPTGFVTTRADRVRHHTRRLGSSPHAPTGFVTTCADRFRHSACVLRARRRRRVTR
eukprot:4340108-Pleurochrysis_carterae.AAC.1